MRKTYGPGYPRTLGALMAWSGLDPEAPAVTDAGGTLDRRAFQNRVLHLTAGLRCVLGLQLPAGVTQLVGLPVLPLDGAVADAGPDEATGERPCLTFTTSGTTGGPKLVLHDQQAIAGHAADVARHIGLDAPAAV